MSVPTVLEKIAGAVQKRLDERKTHVSASELQTQAEHARFPHDFRAAFTGPGVHVLSEIKFASPSQGDLADGSAARAVAVAREYLSHGAAAISILTEQDYFNGSLEYLKAVRAAFPDARLLLKDFVVDEYQLAEARVAGADAALLIVALLGEPRTAELLAVCRKLGLTALVEVHDDLELAIAQRVGADLIGVNNRNLKTLDISLEVSDQLIQQALPGTTLISESGLSEGAQLRRLRELGFSGFLIGTTFMKTGQPGQALAKIIAEAQ